MPSQSSQESPSTTATATTISDDAAIKAEAIEDVGDGSDGVQIGPDNPMAHLFDEWYACWDAEVRVSKDCFDYCGLFQ
jgi:hypothetical protein